MNLLVQADVQCPHCGEMVAVTVDTSHGDHAMTEDCAVCCQPIDFSIECHPGEVLDIGESRMKRDEATRAALLQLLAENDAETVELVKHFPPMAYPVWKNFVSSNPRRTRSRHFICGTSSRDRGSSAEYCSG